MSDGGAVVLAGLKRTRIGKMGGRLSRVSPHDLLAGCLGTTIESATDKHGNPVVPDEVVVGNVRNGIGNIARVSAMMAGVPEAVPALTVDRQCASSLEALAIACDRIVAGRARSVLVGGVESASLCPWLYDKTTRPYSYFEPRPHEVLIAPKSTGNIPMGETAEILADEFSLGRAEVDEFALRSHLLATKATKEGAFDLETSPLEEISVDECVRPDAGIEDLAKLKPAFRKEGIVTAGNSSPLNDGAASCLVMSAETANRLGVEPQAIIHGFDVVGLDPNRMGLGPALTIPRLLTRHNVTAKQVDLFEINEAFSAQILASLRHLSNESGINIPNEKINVNGGAIALGHPLGATGLRLVVTLAHALAQRNLRSGVAALCVGGGQGMSALVGLPR